MFANGIGGGGGKLKGDDRVVCRLNEKLLRYMLAVTPMDKPMTKKRK